MLSLYLSLVVFQFGAGAYLGGHGAMAPPLESHYSMISIE